MEQREWDATGGLRDRLKGEEDKVEMITMMRMMLVIVLKKLLMIVMIVMMMP